MIYIIPLILGVKVGIYIYIKLHYYVNIFICTPSCILYNVRLAYVGKSLAGVSGLKCDMWYVLHPSIVPSIIKFIQCN